MANKIVQLTPASALDGAELAWVEQGGNPVKTTTQSIANLGGGGGDSPWTLETASFTLVADDKKSIEATSGAVDATLPGTIVVGDVFIVHNASTSTQTVQIDPATHSIKGALGTVSSSDTLVLAIGETVYLVAVTTSVLEVV